jgi:NRPS condensation-like uncharacterized protein
LSVGTAVRAAEGLNRARFAVADELTCYYDRPDEPANVHLEARVPARLDEGLLRAAVAAVLEAEPELRARQSQTSRWRPAFYWEYQASADVDPVRTASFADEAELDRLRSELLSQSPSLQTCPPWRLLLATGPGGDALILNAHHASIDGLSCLRLLRLVADEYTVRAGQAPALGPGGNSLSRADVDGPAPRRVKPGRIAKVAREPDAGSRSGYGISNVRWDGLAEAVRLRSAGVSVNDLLIAALMVTIAGWNYSHGRKPGLLKITMPVGDPAQAGADGRWANTSRLTSVTARAEADPADSLLADVAAQTRYAKEHVGPQVDFFCRTLAVAPVPVAVKARLLRTALGLAGSFLCDTCLVSNLGVAPPIRFGAATASALWFSTFAHMPRGLSLGTVTADGVVHLSFRYRRALFGDAAAAAFAGRYTDALDRLVRREAAR